MALAGAALAGLAGSAAAARIELTAAPAWQGWSRPGRATELDLRVASDTATRATLTVSAGRQSVRTEVDLQPGRAVRLHLPVGVAESARVAVAPGEGEVRQLDVALHRSESPLLGVALAAPQGLALEGFHAIALTAEDLPHQAAAYAGIDALVVDAPTLAALDAAQIGALLAHGALCGRIVVVAADAALRSLLDGAGGCGGRALMQAATAAEAPALLAASLAEPLQAAIPPAAVDELARPDMTLWTRIAVAAAAYLAAALLAALFVTAWPAAAAAAALATLAALALPQLAAPSTRLAVWGEAESGAKAARYQGWQRVQGAGRGRVEVAVPPQLAAAVQPCNAAQPVQFGFDAAAGRVAWVSFDTRLFGQVSLCYAGSFTMTRRLAVDAIDAAAGARRVRNAGPTAWPRGLWLAEGRAAELPALAPGAVVTMVARAESAASAAAPNATATEGASSIPAAVQRAALARTPPGRGAALWPLDLGGVAALPTGARGWLLVTAEAP